MKAHSIVGTRFCFIAAVCGLFFSIPRLSPSQAPASTIDRPAKAGAQTGDDHAPPPFTGTIIVMKRDGFSLNASNSTSPEFRLKPGTEFTDSEGRAAKREQFTAGQAVTVHHARSGGELIATRVVALQPKGIFTAGTVTEVGPGFLTIESPNAPNTPVRYVSNATTTYVTQKGEPLARDRVKAGVTVKVYYSKEGDTMIASKVEVQDAPSTSPKPKAPKDAGTVIRRPVPHQVRP